MTTRIAFKDLPAAMRKGLRQTAGPKGGDHLPAPVTASRRPRGEARAVCWRCHYCRLAFRAWAPAERHGWQPGHRRIELIL